MTQNEMPLSELVAQFERAITEDRWDVPFPMAVFGTLREGWTNNHLMGRKEGTPWKTIKSRNYFFRAHYKAFLPHFRADGLSLMSCTSATCPCEVFLYVPLEWGMMIGSVDRLEGFTPASQYGGYYHRTLMWVHILPSKFTHPLFDQTTCCGSTRERDLKIPEEEWKKYPRLPCWVYSSVAQNEKSARSKKTPIIWDGVIFKNLGRLYL